MARLSRMVLAGIPHHVTQRGNRRERTFFEDADYALYLDLLAQAAERHGVEVWSYCLMPNHVHIVAMPRDEDALGRTFSQVHRTYTGYVNARLRTTGHLWQGRFGSVAMDEGTGRPIGSPEWLEDMEARTGKVLRPQKRGRKASAAAG